MASMEGVDAEIGGEADADDEDDAYAQDPHAIGEATHVFVPVQDAVA